MSGGGGGFPGEGLFDQFKNQLIVVKNGLDDMRENQALTAKLTQEIFSHHTYEHMAKQNKIIADLEAKIKSHESQMAGLEDERVKHLTQIADLRGKLFDIDMNAIGYRELYMIIYTALTKIEDPRLMDHQERDLQTKLYCLQNVAHVALETIRGVQDGYMARVAAAAAM